MGSHVTGYANMAKSMVDYFSEKNGSKTKTVNLIPGFIEPSDMTEIKRLATLMGVKTIMFPDTSKVLNGPLTGKFKMFPEGGVTIEQLRKTGSSNGSLGLGEICAGAAARALDAKCKVPCQVINLPIGLQDTDIYIDTLRRLAGVNVSEEINLERGQLVDAICDWQQYLHGKRVALVGDPDHLLALARFLTALD
ncbi:MAG: nitrogenase component 1, partial [Desulfosarcinaceae bacterium]